MAPFIPVGALSGRSVAGAVVCAVLSPVIQALLQNEWVIWQLKQGGFRIRELEALRAGQHVLRWWLAFLHRGQSAKLALTH